MQFHIILIHSSIFHEYIEIYLTWIAIIWKFNLTQNSHYSITAPLLYFINERFLFFIDTICINDISNTKDKKKLGHLKKIGRKKPGARLIFKVTYPRDLLLIGSISYTWMICFIPVIGWRQSPSATIYMSS